MKRKRSAKIVYDGQVKDFSDIFILHPLKSNKNKSIFENIGRIDKDSKDSNIKGTFLDKGLTFKLLQQVAKNNIQDVFTFYEISNHTVKHWIENKEIYQKTYQELMTSIALSHKGSPSCINFLSQLDDNQSKNVVNNIVINYGIEGYKILKENTGNYFTNEQILSYLITSKLTVLESKKQLFVNAIEYISSQKAFTIDCDKLSSLIKDNAINPYVGHILRNNLSGINNTLISRTNATLKNLYKGTPDKDLNLGEVFDIYNVAHWLITYDVHQNKPKKDFTSNTYSLKGILSTIDKSNAQVVEILEDIINEKLMFFSQQEDKKVESTFWLQAKLQMSIENKAQAKIRPKI